MSAIEPREHHARVDRAGPLDGSDREGSLFVSRRSHLGLTLITALSLGSFVWVGEERTQVRTATELSSLDSGSGPAIPLHVNPRVERWLNEFRTARSDEFRALLERRAVFEDIIRRKLRERGMPEDLLYLAMIESGFSPWAVSRVSAVGLWQFMGPTALQFGLRVDEHVDERRDPVRATDAALDYLQYLYLRFDSWYLAAAAYNAGPGRVERILNRHADGRKGEEELYWEVLRYLPHETREYVPKLIAASILAADAEATGMEIAGAPAYEYDQVFVPGGTRLTSVAQSLDVDRGVLRDLNPHLTRGVTPPGEIYGVRVPKGRGWSVVASLEEASGSRRAD